MAFREVKTRAMADRELTPVPKTHLWLRMEIVLLSLRVAASPACSLCWSQRSAAPTVKVKRFTCTFLSVHERSSKQPHSLGLLLYML